MRAATLALGVLLVATPAHAFLTGQPSVGGQGAYTQQGDSGTSQSGNFLSNYFGSKKKLGPLGTGKNKTCPNCQPDKLQDDSSGKGLADAVAAAAAKSAEQK